MKRTARLLGVLALSAVLAVQVQGAWIKEWADKDCSNPVTNIGGVPGDDSCVPYCPGGSCWGSQRLSCSNDGIIVQRFVGNDCSGQKVHHANFTQGAPVDGKQCLETMVGAGTWFSVHCQEPVAAQATASVTRYYDSADCGKEIYGPVYSNYALGACRTLPDGESTASYCESDGSGVQTYQFASDTCLADTWTAVNHDVGSTASKGSCVATWNDDRVIYSKTFCPTDSGNRGAKPPNSWPPKGASPAFRCAASDCSSGCTQRIANRLGYCQRFLPTSSSRQTCTRDGLNRALAVTYGDKCAGDIYLAFVLPVGTAASACNGNGEYNTCPAASDLAPESTLPKLEGIWAAEYRKPGCAQKDYKSATYTKPNACLYGSQELRLSPPSQINSWYSDSEEAPCKGGYNTTIETFEIGKCYDATPAISAPHSFVADGMDRPAGAFVLPYSDVPNSGGFEDGNTDGSGSGTSSGSGDNTNDGGTDNNGGSNGGTTDNGGTSSGTNGGTNGGTNDGGTNGGTNGGSNGGVTDGSSNNGGAGGVTDGSSNPVTASSSSGSGLEDGSLLTAEGAASAFAAPSTFLAAMLAALAMLL